MTVSEERMEPTTPLDRAGMIWTARLESAGLDLDQDADDLDDEERRVREEQRHHAQRTIETYQLALTLFVRWATRQGRSCLGDLQLDDLLTYARSLRRRTYDLSQRAQQAIEAGQEVERLSPRTIHAYVRPLLGFLALADSFDALPFRAAAIHAEIVRALPRLPDPVAPTPPDLRRLVTHYDKPRSEADDRTDRLLLIRLRNAALLHLLFSSGARISEALSLDAGDVCRDRRILQQAKVSGKGRREGTLFIRRPAERALRRYLEARSWPPASAALFESLDRRTAGMRLTRTSGWRIVHGAAEALANQVALEGKVDEAELLRATSPHSFRHFVGYHLLNEGVALAEVSQILRHRSVEVTRSYYASYRDVQLQEVHDQFSADPLE
ncbi:tyrosine-type recombinase/integrase [Oscillochloris sp. ZM17-4]|uniref:tyrosine-type recombinase/integrase n=1 Tax=Oscillochloris sp. ZM17-4 TaxID=2866714 RepID=UPI001C73773A|nr:tyrosine-type recombinase/integrase [Oscillochloris sp. ZM17-4]MBX0326566.1 tyrosine-type recombinase/integrase [Oscillochloris sp. ZM17-4]